MQKVQSFLNSAVIISGLSHIFCCGLPLFVSFLSLLAGAGVATVLPSGLNEFHEMIHNWEVPMLMGSGVILFAGWTLHLISERIDCHDTGCGHEPCEPKKKKSSKVLLLATALFCINTIVLFAFHV